MVDAFHPNAETSGLASVPHDLLPILSQPPYSLPLGGCDKIGNKSPSADWTPCWRRQLLAMSWHSSVSDVLSPYPPRPSPPLPGGEGAHRAGEGVRLPVRRAWNTISYKTGFYKIHAPISLAWC